MTVSNRHILDQGAALGALGRVALRSLEQQLRGRSRGGDKPQVPGPYVEATLPPRRPALVHAYVQNVGGDPSSYAGIVPAHFFPQWAFGLASQVLEGLPYPLARVLNVGCNFVQRAPLPAGEPLTVRARLASIDDDGRRAVLTSEVVTSTRSAPDALTAEMIAMVPLKRDRAEKKSGDKRETARAPDDARELGRLRVDARAGLDFAKLTGDFNPIHWLPPAARAAGFPNVILHGFGTMARAIEVLTRTELRGDVTRLQSWSCRFTKPLVLPAEAGVYVRGNELFVARAAGDAAYLVASYET